MCFRAIHGGGVHGGGHHGGGGCNNGNHNTPSCGHNGCSPTRCSHGGGHYNPWTPCTSSKFLAIKQQIAYESNSIHRLEVAMRLIKRHHYTTQQASQIVVLFNNSIHRLEVAKEIYLFTCDKHNFHNIVRNQFSNSVQRMDLYAYMDCH